MRISSPWRSTAWSALLALADALFGSAAAPPDERRSWLARWLGLAGVLAAIVVARRPDALTRPQFWAEDGNVFFRDQVLLGFWDGIATLYGGFPFLAQRVIAALASLAPMVDAPLVYDASAIAITALTMATFVLPAFRHLVRSDGIRAAVCVAVVCMPAGQELLATPTTLGYFLAVWVVFLSLMRAPRTAGGVVLWCLGGIVSVFSTQLTTVAAPLWALRGVRGIARRTSPDVAFAASQLATLLVVVLLAGGMSGVAGLQGDNAKLVADNPALQWHPVHLWVALRSLPWVMAACVDSVVVPLAVFRELFARGTAAVVLPAALVAVAIVATLRATEPRARVVVGLAAYVLAASIYLVLAGRPLVLLLLQGDVPLSPFGMLGPRHRVLPNLALVLAAAALADGARRPRTRAVVATLALLALLGAWTPELRVEPFPNLQWPRWAARLDEKLATGSREPLVIPSHPPYFELRFDAPPRPE